MEKNLFGLILILLGCYFPLRSQNQQTINIGFEFTLKSEILKEERQIIVSLPEGYEKGNDRYPVLYLLDGRQNIMHVSGSIEVLTRTGSMPPTIIVGIKSINRVRDFTPSKDPNNPNSGGGKEFLNFIQKELIPFIDSKYRTHPFRILEGHSLGGLFTAYALMEAPELFNSYIVMSPAFWWNKEEITLKAKDFFNTSSFQDQSIFFSIGTEDGYGMQQELKRFVDVIATHKPQGLRWKHQNIESEGHMSAPLLINYYGLKYTFSDLQLPKTLIKDFDIEAFYAHEKKIMNKYGTQAKQTAEAYVTLAFQLQNNKNYEGAIALLKRDAEAYPEYPRSWSWLAKAYEANGQNSLALSSYEKALEKAAKIKFGEEKEYKAKIQELKNKIKGK